MAARQYKHPIELNGLVSDGSLFPAKAVVYFSGRSIDPQNNIIENRKIVIQ